MASFTKIADQQVHAGFRFTVNEVRYRAEDGSEFDRDVVRHAGAVAVLPLHDDDSVTLVRQFRAALDDELLELPAGMRDVAGEADVHTARRELMEEAGLDAARLEHLVTFHNSPGFCDETVGVFLATGLQAVPDARQGIEEELMTVERIPLADALEMVRDGRITDAKTIIALTITAARRQG
ncbi:MAG: NUDIX hydrolase [Acidimicrobiales bacterium]